MAITALSIIAVQGIPLVREGDDVAALILVALDAAGQPLQTDDVVVIAQKIVSKAEGRTMHLDRIDAGPEAERLAVHCDKDARMVQAVLDESRSVIRAKRGVIVVEDRRGLILANAGIDRSNVAGEDELLLLPVDADMSARRIRAGIGQAAKVAVGVIIADSIGRAWRRGTVGSAIGAAGIECLQDLRGRPDLFGRALQSTEVGRGDEIAAAASLLMGQADEAVPAVVLRGLTGLGDGRAADLIRPAAEDMFR